MVGLVLVACACGAPAASPVVVPQLQRAEAERIAVLADQIERAVMAGKAATALADVFRGQALEVLRAQDARLAERRLLIEERDVVSRLVFFDQHAAEGVLAVSGRHRLVASDDPNPPWASTMRQWWMRFAYESGGWWIIDQRDLPPDRWVSVPLSP